MAATTTTFQVGTYNSITDAFTLVLDLNDRQTFYLHASGGSGGSSGSSGLKMDQPEKVKASAFNIRTPGEYIARVQYKNRTIQASVWIRSSPASTTTLLASVRSLLSAIEHPPYVLRLQLPGGTQYSYADVVHVTHNIPTDPHTILAGAITHVEMHFECLPFFRGDRVTLSNLVVNPGFEAPSGPAVTVFNDTFANFNAYTPQQYQTAVQADTPLRYYRMQEITGTTAIDSGSALVNGTYTGGVTLGQAGICGGASFAALFNGSTGYLSAPTTGLPSGNAAFTLEAWCYFTTNPGSTQLLAVMGTNASNQDIRINLNSTGHVVSFFSGGSTITSGVLTTNTWHQVAVTWDGTTLRQYVDGVAAGTPITPAAANITLGSLVFGATEAGGSNFAGTLDEAAVYSTALSSARILAHYNAGSPTVLAQDTYQFPDAVDALQGAAGASATTLSVLRYYRLDESSGTTTYDASGNVQNGTTHGSPTQSVASLLTGDSDTCYTFASASSQYVSVPNTSLPIGNSAMSFAAIIKFASNPASSALIWGFGASAHTAHNNVQLFIDTSGKLNADNGSTLITSGSALSTGTPHFVVVTWDGTTMTLYADGSSVGTPTTPGAQTIAASPNCNLAANSNSTPAFFFNGQIDEAVMFSGCLTSAQVTSLYNAFHVAPAVTANTMLLPAGARLMFGSPAWGAINTWQVRFRWLSSSAPTFYLHYTDANNYLAAAVTGTALTVNQVVGGVTHQVGTQALQLVNGVQYWLQVTQFPSVNPAASTYSPYLTVQLFYDSHGAVGSSVASAITGATFDGVTAIAGRPQIAASGASLGVGGNFSNVHSVSLFGPGGWTMTASQNAVTGLVSGAWDQTTANCYPNGPVTSYGAGRMDLPPGGTVDALWQLYTGGGTPATTYAIPVQTATNVIGYSAYVKETGLASGATVALYITEYNSSGTSLRNSGNLGALTAGTLPTSWTQISGNYTTGANCAYVDIALRVVDTAVAAESAGATVWWDNIQVWDRTRTGMTTMPYCELAFAQSPAQLMVSGLVGDVLAPAFLSLLTYEASWAPSATIQFWCGRRLIATQSSILTGTPVSQYTPVTITPTLDSTSYGGYYQSGAALGGWAIGYMTGHPGDLKGTYHFLTRFRSSQSTGNIKNVTVSPVVLQDQNPYSGGASWDLLASATGSSVTPLSAGSTWTVCDIGQTVIPFGSQTALANPETGYMTPFASWNDSTGGGSTGLAGWAALLPVDGEVLIGTATNGVGIQSHTYTNTWFGFYFDGLSTGPASGSSYGTNAIPAPTTAAVASGGTGGVALNNAGDSIINLDPTLIPVSGGPAVNSLCAILTDSSAAVLPVVAECTYSPKYLYPR